MEVLIASLAGSALGLLGVWLTVRQGRLEATQNGELKRIQALWGRLDDVEAQLATARLELIDCHVQRDHLRSRVLKLELHHGLPPGDGD